MKYKVFFNPDCNMYGVKKYINTGYKVYTTNGEYEYKKEWVQILPPNNKGARNGQSAYTHYKKVAERWISELKEIKE